MEKKDRGGKRQSLMLIISQFYIYSSLITLWCWKSHLKICSSDVSLVQLLVFITECGLQQFCKLLLFSCCSSVGCPGVSERYFQLSAWVQSLTLPAIVSSRTAGTTCWESQRQQDIAGILLWHYQSPDTGFACQWMFCFVLVFFFNKIHTIFYCNDAIIQKWLPISFKINLDLKVKFKLVPFKISQRYFKYLELFMFYISNVTQNLTLYLYQYVRSGDVTLPAHTLLGLSTVNCLLSNLQNDHTDLETDPERVGKKISRMCDICK